MKGIPRRSEDIGGDILAGNFVCEAEGSEGVEDAIVSGLGGFSSSFRAQMEKVALARSSPTPGGIKSSIIVMIGSRASRCLCCIIYNSIDPVCRQQSRVC